MELLDHSGPTSPPDQRERKNMSKIKRQDGSAGGGGGVALDLDQVQREQEKENSNRGIQKQRKQVRATEAAGFEQLQREHR